MLKSAKYTHNEYFLKCKLIHVFNKDKNLDYEGRMKEIRIESAGLNIEANEQIEQILSVKP